MDEEDSETESYMPTWLTSYGFRDLCKAADIEFVALVESSLFDDVISWDYESRSWLFEFHELVIHISFCSDWQDFLSVETVDKASGISRKTLDALRTRLRDIARKHSMVCLNDLAILMLQILEEACATLHEWRLPDGEGFNSTQVRSWDDIVDDPVGLNLNSVEDTAEHILKRSIKDICANVPSNCRILHVESILRPDLTKRFWRYQQRMREQLGSPSMATVDLRGRLPPRSANPSYGLSSLSREKIIDDLVTPRVTFHGTYRHNVASIVQHGLLMPGTAIEKGVVVSPRSGIAWSDRGIYSSPEAFYALSYAPGYERIELDEIPGRRLLVCATLMGRTLRESKHGGDVHGKLRAGFDSHVTYNEFEYIVHHPAQILPCYVIHLDMGAKEAREAMKRAQQSPTDFQRDEARKIKTHPKLLVVDLSPGDLQRAKAAKQAAASKWFPYGYGPATGTSFVIEEIGEPEDDEENYGEYQDARHAKSYTDWSMILQAEEEEEVMLKGNLNGALFLDEYTAAREGPRRLPPQAKKRG